jgi:hypothetical protein
MPTPKTAIGYWRRFGNISAARALRCSLSNRNGDTLSWRTNRGGRRYLDAGVISPNLVHRGPELEKIVVQRQSRH